MRGALLLVLLGGCATTNTGPAMPAEFKPTGEVVLGNRSASFDAWRVINARCNLARRGDGSWAGTFEGQAVDVTVTEDRVVGIGLQMTRELQDGRSIITGQFNGRIVRFEFDDERALLRTPFSAYTISGRFLREGATVYGADGMLQLKGEAGLDVPPWPQIAFALLASS